MKRFFAILMVTVFAGFVMTSCGGSSNKATSEKKQEAPKQEVKKEVKKETKKEVSAADFTANLENGKKIYSNTCVACHMTGVAGAAKITDKERWEATASQGEDVVFNHALHGFQGKHGVMPEKGTCTACSEQDIYDAFHYILHEAGVSFK
jgi:cytochrome c5